VWFGGGSWAAAWSAGVLSGLRWKWGDETVACWKAGGASAGACIALGMLLEKTDHEFLTFFHVLADRARRRGVIGKMGTYTNEFLRDWLPENGDEYERLNGRLFVAITRFPYGMEILSHWTSNRELRNTMNASSAYPPLPSMVAVSLYFLVTPLSNSSFALASSSISSLVLLTLPHPPPPPQCAYPSTATTRCCP
jgi:predicted acylesterase/phospholipase RssA